MKRTGAPIVKVTVMEDRAYVVRETPLELTAGQHHLAIGPVTATLVDKTAVAGLVEPTGPAIVRDLTVSRRAVPEAAGLADLANRSEALAQEQERLEAERALLREEHSRLNRLADNLMREFVQDSAWGRSDEEEWRRRLEAVEQRQRKLTAQDVELEAEFARSRRRWSEFQTEYDRVKAEPPRVEARLELLLEASEDCHVRLRLEYCVPGACWRPYHRASLAGGTLAFECEACVWQNSGEDWEGVRLNLSTQRASQGATPPALVPDHLLVQTRNTETVVACRDEEVTEFKPRSRRPATLKELPGIDDGGQSLTLEAASPARVPSDGQPVRLALFDFAAEARTERVLVPEVATLVMLKSVQTNEHPRPLLAGPVDLVRDSGVAGSTHLEYVAPGEPFELCWGPDSAVTVERKLDEGEEQSRMLSGWVSTTREITLWLSNLGLEPRTLRVSERLPISEIKSVEISLDRKATTDQSEPDENGFIHWEVELTARQRKQIKLRYVLRRKRDVMGV